MKYYYKTKINNYFFTIVEEDNFITYITLDDLEIDGLNKKTTLIAKTKVELEEYLKALEQYLIYQLNLREQSFKIWYGKK